MIQRLPKSAVKMILKFYNIVWHKGTIPLDFKHGIIIPILKPNKSLQEATSYRPICLTSCLEKIMERMVTDRLTYYLEYNKGLTKSAFRKNRSNIDQIIKLQDEINRNIHTIRDTLVVFSSTSNVLLICYGGKAFS